jgi:hypothetical protein
VSNAHGPKTCAPFFFPTHLAVLVVVALLVEDAASQRSCVRLDAGVESTRIQGESPRGLRVRVLVAGNFRHTGYDEAMPSVNPL